MRDEFADALRTPAQENEFRRFRINQWVGQESRWIPLTEWDKGGEPFDKQMLLGRVCYGGMDLSTRGDITAFKLLFPIEELVYELAWYWLPEEKLKQPNPSSLLQWKRQGFIEETPGNVIDYVWIRKAINEAAALYDIQEIGYDPWNAHQLVQELQEQDGFTLVEIRQGFASLNSPSKAYEERILAGRIRHGGHPVSRWMMDCCSVRFDPAGNIKPVKPDYLRTSKRVDGVHASIMALDRLVRHEVQELTADSAFFA
jgi:phage terminase large subunit-like protein